jgi:AraC-like DNA-binding protein
VTPQFIKIIPGPAQSFIWKEDPMRNPTGWHFHPELELLYVIQGTGTRFIGDDIAPIRAGELVLIGENLPHAWQADQVGDGEVPRAVVVQFRREFLGTDFFAIPEFAHLGRLLDRAAQGLLFAGETVPDVTDALLRLGTQPPMERIFTLLGVLDQLAARSDDRPLARPGFLEEYHRTSDERIDRVYDFTLAQFGREITLRQAAGAAGMNEASFCRYFKAHTRKTYVEFLNEIRVGYACRQLLATDRDVAQICYECGFGTISNFNRRFKLVTGLTPTQYRAQARRTRRG